MCLAEFTFGGTFDEKAFSFTSFFDLFYLLEFRIKMVFGVVCYFPSSPTMPLLSHVESALYCEFDDNQDSGFSGNLKAGDR